MGFAAVKYKKLFISTAEDNRMVDYITPFRLGEVASSFNLLDLRKPAAEFSICICLIQSRNVVDITQALHLFVLHVLFFAFVTLCHWIGSSGNICISGCDLC